MFFRHHLKWARSATPPAKTQTDPDERRAPRVRVTREEMTELFRKELGLEPIDVTGPL